MIGAGIAAVPLLVLLVILLVWYPEIGAWLYPQPEEEQTEVVVLSHPLSAQEVVKEEDVAQRLEACSVAPEGCLTKEELIGKRLKVSLSTNTILTDRLVYEGEELSEDERIHYFDYIECSDTLQAGDYVDIRIVFPNGADFVLLAKKRIETAKQTQDMDTGRFQSQLWFQVNEREILTLSSALVDMYLTKDCRIYAIQYLLDSQEEAQVNYPVNDVVRQLMEKDPNLVAVATQAARDQLRTLVGTGESMNSEQQEETDWFDEERFGEGYSGAEASKEGYLNQGYSKEGYLDEVYSGEGYSEAGDLAEGYLDAGYLDESALEKEASKKEGSDEKRSDQEVLADFQGWSGPYEIGTNKASSEDVPVFYE